MPFCSNCGKSIYENSSFCMNCGAKVRKTDERKTIFDGTVHKCPNCGEVLPSFVLACPSCGFELRDVTVSDAVHQFAIRLEKAVTDQEKASVIRNFPISNTKEDIWEFLILASTNAESELTPEINSAWLVKSKQAYEKASLLIKDGSEFEAIEIKYNTVHNLLSKNMKKRGISKNSESYSYLSTTLPEAILIAIWFIGISLLIPLSGKETGWFVFDFALLILGAIFVPRFFRNGVLFPRILVIFGLIEVIALMIIHSFHCKETVQMFMLSLTAIVCGLIILFRMFSKKNAADKESKQRASGTMFIPVLICAGLYFAAYEISHLCF